MSTFKPVFIYWAKKFLFIFGILVLTIPFSQKVSASSPLEFNVSGSPTYFVAGEPVLISPGLTLTGDNIDSVQVSITANFASSDYLGIQGETGTSGSLNGITWSYDTATGIMDLQNNATTSTYQSVLRQITYYSTSGILSSTTRTIDFSIGSSLYLADTGHLYEYISSPGISWDDARTAAAGRSYFGLQGYLATVTSQAENNFILSKLQGNAWMGATDSVTESQWYWVTGPEGAANSGSGTYFFLETGAAANSVDLVLVYGGNENSPFAIDGNAVAGLYNNWALSQPDDWGSGEHYAHFYYEDWQHIDGTWNDYPVQSYAVRGYVVEYGGIAGDPALQLTGNVTVNVELSADVSITKLGLPFQVKAGGNLTYILTVSSSGPSTASNVVATETYPAGFTYSTADPSPDTGTNNKWTFSSIAANTSQTIRIKGTVTKTPGTLTNTASVTSSTDDPNPANNTSSLKSTVYIPRGVGGEVIPVNRLAILTLWLVLIGVLMIGGIILVVNRRKRS
jgi:uncharacterized repeat protein (TIGR01451 family)